MTHALHGFDHLAIPVTDLTRSRGWHVGTLGLTVEFEVPDRRTVALQDSDDFTISLQEAPAAVQPSACVLYFQVADVKASSPRGPRAGSSSPSARARSAEATGPRWGTPTGTSSVFWDERSMKEKCSDPGRHADVKPLGLAILIGMLLGGLVSGCAMSPAEQEAARRAWAERDAERARECARMGGRFVAGGCALAQLPRFRKRNAEISTGCAGVE